MLPLLPGKRAHVQAKEQGDRRELVADSVKSDTLTIAVTQRNPTPQLVTRVHAAAL
jgi:hypothetical protein